MGAKTDLASDPRQRQMAREGMRMRQERIRQRREQGEGNQAGEASFFPGMAPPSSPVARQEQRGAGIAFGPGRAMRVPPADSPEYQQMLERFRRG
jgi:hypothetical protein